MAIVPKERRIYIIYCYKKTMSKLTSFVVASSITAGVLLLTAVANKY
jgi:hypothetical protein